MQQFLETNKSNKIVKNKLTEECRQVLVKEVQQSTRLQLESDYFSGKKFLTKKKSSPRENQNKNFV